MAVQVHGHFVPAILRLEPFEVDRIIDRMLEAVGEALGTEQIVFAAPGDPASCQSTREWNHPAALEPSAEAVTIRITVAGHCVGVLSIGARPDGEPFSPLVRERLSALADRCSETVA